MNSTYEDKLDAEFVATVADPVRRTTAISNAIKRRTKLLWIVGIVSLGFFIIFFSGKPLNSPVIFVVFLAWMQLYKCEADLRLLRVIERLKSEERSAA